MSGASLSSYKIPTTVVIPFAAAPAQPQQRPYVCEDCEKAFATARLLTRHRRVHTGEMNYACAFPGCTHRCARKDNTCPVSYRLHFDVRDPEKLKRIAPEKRRRKARVARINTVEGPGQWTEYVPGSSSGTHPRSTNPADSHASRSRTAQAGYSLSPSFSGDGGSVSSPYGTPQPSPYLQERFPTLSAGQAQYAPPRGDYIPTGHSPSVRFSSNDGSISSPVQTRYATPFTSTRIALTQPRPPASASGNDSSFASPYPTQLPSPSLYPQAQDAYPFAHPGYGAAYPPSYE